MAGDLVRWVDQQLEESGLDDETGLLILAALEGDRVLRGYLDDKTAPERPSAEASTAREPGGTFLSSLAVEGFRGIGPAVNVPLTPRPGLTIIAGRNGSGKSSLSEALEFVLTGDTYRWNKSSVEWRKAWRNLHHPHAKVEVGLVEEDSGPLKVTATWVDDESTVDNATVKSQRAGEKQTDGLGELGWAKALEQFRPILSYDELGGLLEGGRAQLYDALTSILGVDQLSDALKRIHVQLQERKKPGTELSARRRQLATQVDSIDDERAESAKKLLGKTAPDVAALRALATGSATVETGPVAALRRLVALPDPFTADEVNRAVGLLRSAVAGLADAKDEVSERSMARLELLETALSVHKTHGDMQCPVCRTGELDAEWHSLSSELVSQQRKEYSEVRRARQDLTVALSTARRLVAPPPVALSSAPVPELDDAVRCARQAWDAWADVPAGHDAATATALADHLAGQSELATSLSDLRGAAQARVAELDDVWQPFASQLAGWCDAWTAWLADKPLVDQLNAAHQWLKENDLRLKNERLAPIEVSARGAWARLRQESNVDIGNLTLTGSGNQRRVVIDASVDGTQVQGFTVLSQGELHALALSLFLPRATMAASPFRFVVLDDPVQAMDPAKVDGLVELLSDLAQTRQVIVLSHDDRLAAAVRRADVDATVLEVARGSGSRVSVTIATDPAARYIGDAFALIRETEEDRLPDAVMRRTLPGLLRFAVEAVARDRFFGSQLESGVALDDVEDAWTSVSTTRDRVGLAVFGESRPHHELDQWAAAPYRKFALRSIGAAMHSGLKADLDARDAVRDVEKLIADLRGGS
ncbi:AAA family ATPase [Nocardioides ganghwensis]|uniref:Nuclease SbcCD subunit C n=1 Tax=Nocardioides ganghwensis TaxID=252230 RepID=A0A4V1RM63_9ACTN|nr:AAA family ATPase [Nocardioides ganghwensis]MBD3947561.1 AAA family ATPase [Nocardioides ganghwensis]RYB99419.1 recombinase RecF [Nocardioides ganghwensis]